MMTTLGMEALLVGPDFHSEQLLPGSLRKLGFQCHFADSIRAAVQVLGKTHVNLVLCNRNLPDGTGYSLVMPLEGLPITAFLCLSVEDSCLWVAALDHGRNCLGKAAFFPKEFARVLERLAQPHPMPTLAILHDRQSDVA